LRIYSHKRTNKNAGPRRSRGGGFGYIKAKGIISDNLVRATKPFPTKSGEAFLFRSVANVIRISE